MRLENMLQPIINDLNTIINQFDIICDGTNVKDTILLLISQKLDFDVCLAEIKKYNIYCNAAKSMVTNVYYDIGPLNQESAKKALIKYCSEIIDILTKKLVNYHLTYNRHICFEFENLKAKALNVPKDAKRLTKLIDYMLHDSKVLVKELKEKIHKSTEMLSILLEITTLTNDHMRINIDTISWLNLIQPIFIQSNIICEAIKSDFEDDLQKRINILNVEVDNLFPSLMILDNMDNIKKVQEYSEHYDDLIRKVKEIDDQVIKINAEESSFKFPETEFPRIVELKEIVNPFYCLVNVIRQWQKDNSIWLNGPFEYLNPGVIKEKTLDYFTKITEMNKQFKSRIKMDVTSNKSFKFSGITDDPDPMQQPAPLKLSWQALNDIKQFKVYLPLVMCVCNPALKEQHWKEMSIISQFDLTPNAGTTLQKIINFNLIEDLKKYEIISTKATKELCLYQQLSEMQQMWYTISFEIIYCNKTKLFVFKKQEDIDSLLEDHFLKIEEMRASHFVESIYSPLRDFHFSLKKIQEIIMLWLEIQKYKISVSSIFYCQTTKTYLFQENSIYREVNKTLENIQNRISENATFHTIQNDSDILNNLHDANIKMDQIMKSVQNYLDSKRLDFERFFFLSDTDIQNILFESDNIDKLQLCLQKCFPGIKKLKFDKTCNIYSILGDCNESLQLNTNIIILNGEQKWLCTLQKVLKDTIYENLQECYLHFEEKDVCDWITNVPSMVIICISCIYWTSLVQSCYSPFNLLLLKTVYKKYSEFFINLSDQVKNNIMHQERKLLMSLIIITANHKEIIKLLLENNVNSSTDFNWLAQMRYYWTESDIKVSLCNATVNYGYEYNYYQQHLVSTPLTDRCLRTLMEAYSYHLYGTIIGSVATGKTETIKYLINSLAMPYYILNMNERFTYKSILYVLKGLISCGTWICFKNLDKLELSVLSAVTQTIVNIHQVTSTNLKSVMFEGIKLNLNPNGNICIITNVQHTKYYELPDNLKILFRTISMIKPDLNQIIEMELIASGFCNGRELAAKLIIIYKLLSEQLLDRPHYKFNMCSMKTIIKTARMLKIHFQTEDENVLLLRSVIDIILPILCNEDMIIFQNIIHSIFPCIKLPSFNYDTVLMALENVCKSRSLHFHEILKLKSLQIFELMHVQRALILIGGPLTGKTEMLQILADTFLLLHKWKDNNGARVTLEIINPGVINSNQLFGQYKKELNLWEDGLCSKIFRTFATNTSSDKKWLIFDGSLSDVWVENLYTVIDSNKLLHLISGERISMTQTMSIIFETIDLANVSPVIVSHCGMIYIEPQSIGWKPYILSHISKKQMYNKHEKIMYSLLSWSLDACLQFVHLNCSMTINVGELHLVTSTLSLFEIYLLEACNEQLERKENLDHFVIWSQAALILSLVWVLGGNSCTAFQIKFNEFCIALWNNAHNKYPRPEEIKHYDIALPTEGLIQDNLYIFKGVGNWKHYNDLLKGETITDMCNFDQKYVPTLNSIKYSHLFLTHIKYCKPFIICSNTTTGKTVFLQNLLKNKLSKHKYLTNTFNFSSLITAEKAKYLFLSYLSRIKRRYYALPEDKYCINLIDDLNLNTDTNIDSKSVLELIRQYFNYGYWYDTKVLEKIFITNINFLLTITTGHDKHNICPRFMRHFNIYTFPELTTDNIYKIFSNMLLSNLKNNLFSTDVLNNVTSITNATIDVYNSIFNILRPIPAKVQYLFNIRDIYRVISGCSLIQKESIDTKIIFIRLWVHETLRVFGDRILDDDDKEILYQSIKEAVKKYFKDSFESAFDHLPKFEDNKITKNSLRYLLFGNFIELEKTSPKYKKYEEISSLEILKDTIVSYMKDYNNTNIEKIDIVITQQILINLVQICRILAMPGGNAIIISTVRSGKRSITKLASYIQLEQKFFEPTTDSYYNFNIWREDLKEILRMCGESQKNCTFYLTDRQMKNIFLQDINSLLNIGEIPDLFSSEEKLSIIAATRIYAQKGDPNAEINISAVMDYFIQQCKNNLHFVLGFSPINNTMRKYFYLYPNLIKYSTINCYDIWPEDALVEIARIHIETIDILENIKDSVIKACINFHNDAKINSLMYLKDNEIPMYVTNSAFLHTVKLYAHLITKKQEQIITSKNRYMIGLEQLEIAAKQVEKMSMTLTILKPELELSAQRTIKTMREVEHENLTVEKATILIKQEEGIANKKAEIAAVLKSECEADLAVAIPILEDAVLALNTLKPTDITLVKAMKNPPDTVKLVMAAVCVMLGITPDRIIDPISGKKITDYWGPSKRILGDMNFLQNLKDYNKDNIPSMVIQIVKNVYMTDKNFVPHIVAKASSAAEGLCKWVRAMVSYNEIAKVVAPKKEKLVAAQKECDEAVAFLNEKRRTLSNLNVKLATLNNSLQDTLKKKLKLEEEVSNCTKKLQKAESLIASLGSEKERWLQFVCNLQLNYDNLAGDMILSSGIIAYMAPYNIKFRDKMIEKWIKLLQILKLPYSKSYDFVNILGVEFEISSWYLSGLSKNRFSTENAIIMKNSKLWPLFIDSQNQANNWIKEIEKKNGLKVIKFTDPDYISIIQYNIENGIPILLENIGEELEVAIDSLLLKNIYKNGDDWYLKIGRTITKYSLNFRLYVTTRLPNPHYLPHVYNKLIVIDFSLSCEALQDKLLDIIIGKERLELQEQFENIWIEDAINREALKSQEDKILRTLSSTSTNIIEDEKAIQILDSSKTLSLEIIRKQEQAEVMKNKINMVRSTYMQYTKFCAGLFATLNALSNLNHMYRFSFKWFIQLFTRSIQGSNKNIPLEKRLKLLKFSFTQNLHSSVCRSLFEKHKLVYSFLLCSKILLDNKETTEKEINFFSVTDIEYPNSSTLYKAPVWLSTKLWNKICYINDNLPNFYGLAQDISSNDIAWKIYWTSDHLETRTLPDPWNKTLGPIQNLILAKIAKPNKIIYHIIYFVENYLGKMFNYSSQYTMSQSYAESSCLHPLLFILPSYSLPLSFLSAYASTIGYSSKYISLSMENTDQKKAEILIKKAQKDGGWVFLQNCHLAVPWLFQLEKICENFNASNTSLTFRLWLSSYSINEFPISLLQNSIKITLDNPFNIKENLLRSFQSKSIKNKNIFDCCPGKEKIFTKFLYELCFFHIVIKEKNNFGLQGWNIPYDFDYSDFETSIVQLQDLINKYEYVPIEAISYFIGECNYGGKIMNKFDQRCMNYLLNYYCNYSITHSQYFFLNNPKYLLPRKCEYNEIIKHIENMSIDHSAEVFGTDENAIAIRDAKETTEFLTYMSLMSSVTLSKTDEIIEADKLAIIDNIEVEISNICIVENIEKIYHSTLSNPLNIVLIYEIELINKTLIEMRKTLTDLRSAFNGDIMLSNYLEELWKLIYNGQIPYIWKKISNNMEAINLSEFISYLLKKRDFIKDWIKNERPYVIHFGALSYCKMFLSVSKLMFSRKHNVPIQNIYSDFQILAIYEPSKIEKKFNDNFFIYGLYLIGAQWDSQKMTLTNSVPGTYRYEMPIICLKFVTKKIILENVYKCPVYTICMENSIKKSNVNFTHFNQTQSLHIYIMTIPLKTNICVAHWIRRSTALYR